MGSGSVTTPGAGARPVATASPGTTRLQQSIVIPAYDEEDRLPLAMAALAEHLDPHTTEVVVVDDGSTDRTASVADELLLPWPNGRRISLGRNRGKGAAVRTGVLASTGRLVAFVDADSATDASCLHELFGALRTCDVAIGSRALSESVVERYHAERAVMGRAFNLLVRSVTGVPWKDTQCGFKAFRTPVAKVLFSLTNVDGFAFDVEVLDLAHRLGLRTAEVPVRWQHVDGSKVRHLRDSLEMTVDVVRSSRAERHRPVECLHLRVPGHHDLHDLLAGLPDEVVVSTDRGTFELIVPVGHTDVTVAAVGHLERHGVHVERVIRSGNEVLARCRWGELSVGPAPLDATWARSGAGARRAVGLDLTRRAVHRGVVAASRRPTALPVVSRAAPRGARRRDATEPSLLVEGFPRTGKAFVATALRLLTHDAVAVACTAQQPARVERAVRRGVPTLVMARAPVPAIASYLTASSHLRPRRAIAEYIAYHRHLLPFLDDVEVVRFEEATADLGGVLGRIEDRYRLGIPDLDADECDPAEIFASIDEDHVELHRGPDPESTVPRPSHRRATVTAANAASLSHPSLAAMVAEAEHLHGLLAAGRA